MLSYDPNGYATGNLRDDKFYKDFVSSMGMPAGVVTIEPLNCSGAIQTTLNDQVFNIMNGQGSAENFPALPTTRWIFHGNLFLTIYCSVFGVAGPGSVYLGNVYNGADVWKLIYQENIAAATAPINKDQQYNFNSIGFRHLRIAVNAGVVTSLRVEYVFTGVKITF